MATIVLIRHGETDWNVEGRYQGQADPPLNEKGYRQTELLVEKLRIFKFDILYTSPLRRAKQTAKVIAENYRLPIVDEPRFMEINQGEWQTQLRADIKRTYPELFCKWETKPWEVTPPKGEHLLEVKERVLAGLNDVLMMHPQKMIGIVTHRIPIALIKMKYQNLDPDIVRTIQLPNTYFEEIKIDPLY